MKFNGCFNVIRRDVMFQTQKNYWRLDRESSSHARTGAKIIDSEERWRSWPVQSELQHEGTAVIGPEDQVFEHCWSQG